MDPARRTRWVIVAAAVGLAVLSAIGIATRGPQLEPLEVSQSTTYIISPTRADGWVDYPEAVDWMRRASLDAGGTNAALPLLEALGRSALPVGVDRDAILRRLGVEVRADAPSLPALGDVSGDDTRNPEPPAAAME